MDKINALKRRITAGLEEYIYAIDRPSQIHHDITQILTQILEEERSNNYILDYNPPTIINRNGEYIISIKVLVNCLVIDEDEVLPGQSWTTLTNRFAK